MTKERKTEVIRDTVARLERANGLYLTNFSGMTVAQADNLRSEFFKAGVEYVVIKNTLLKRALQDVGGYDGMMGYLVKETGVVFTYDDPVQPARVLEKFMKANQDKPAVKVCVIEKVVFDGARLQEIAKLPSRNDLIAGILGCLNVPMQGVAATINGVFTGLVTVLDAIEKKRAQAA